MFLELVTATGAAIVAVKALKITVIYAGGLIYNGSTSTVVSSSLRIARGSTALKGTIVALACVVWITSTRDVRSKLVDALLRRRAWWLVATTPIVAVLCWRLAAVAPIGGSFFDPEWIGRMIGLSVKIERDVRPDGALFYRDVLVLVVFSLIGLVAIYAAPDRFARVVRRLLITASLGACLITGLELAQFSKTGLPGSGQLLRFTVTRLTELWPILRSNVDAMTLSALVLPFVVWGIARLATRYWYRHVPATGVPRATGYAVLALVPGILLLAWNPRLEDAGDARLASNAILALADLFVGRSNRETNAQAAAEKLPRLFATEGLSLRRAVPGGGRRNLVVIMLESTRSTATSPYPPYPTTTPALASLATRGAIVEDMYAVAPATTAAWIAILDGIWPSTVEINSDWGVASEGPRRNVSLAGLLHSAGYATGFITPTPLTLMDDGVILRNMGFDWLQGAAEINPSDTQGGYMGLQDRATVAPALVWIEAQVQKKRPFFLGMMTAAAHDPYDVPSSWRKRTFDAKASSRKDDYLNCVAYTDSVVQEFLAELDKRGILDSTVVVILGDHGEGLGSHGENGHGSLAYEETVRVPAVLFAKGLVEPGTRIAGLRQQIDVIPTVVELLGLAVEGGSYPGVSMLHDTPPNRELFFTAAYFGSALSSRRGPLEFHFFLDRSASQVYNVVDDPDETRDLSGIIPAAELAAAEERMLLWRARVMRSLLPP